MHTRMCFPLFLNDWEHVYHLSFDPTPTPDSSKSIQVIVWQSTFGYVLPVAWLLFAVISRIYSVKEKKIRKCAAWWRVLWATWTLWRRWVQISSWDKDLAPLKRNFLLCTKSKVIWGQDPTHQRFPFVAIRIVWKERTQAEKAIGGILWWKTTI